MSIYKACDIRGNFGTELLVEHAAKLGQALASLKGPAPVLVGGDGRLSTPLLKERLINSLLESGCDVFDLGCISTPMFYFARQKLGHDLGVMVTASHNPASDNGFKITPGPLPITDEEMEELVQAMERAVPLPPAPASGKLEQVDIFPAYLDYTSQFIPDLTGLKIVIDCANGMNSLAVRQVWEKTGAQVVFLLADVDGHFPVHSPNPAERKNLKYLQEQMAIHPADLGIAYDGDGDRVAFVDELGSGVTGDQAILLFAQAVQRDGPQTIIYDQKCSRSIAEMIRAQGGTAIMERSGHTYIKRTFLKTNAAYAGELSGHHFLRPYGDDALIASLFFASLVKNAATPLSQMVGMFPRYPITPDIRIPMPAERVSQVLVELDQRLKGEAIISTLDGLRIEYPDGWALIRPSVTEPVLTLRFEGVNELALQRIFRRVEEIVPELAEKLVD